MMCFCGGEGSFTWLNGNDDILGCSEWINIWWVGVTGEGIVLIIHMCDVWCWVCYGVWVVEVVLVALSQTWCDFLAHRKGLFLIHAMTVQVLFQSLQLLVSLLEVGFVMNLCSAHLYLVWSWTLDLIQSHLGCPLHVGSQHQTGMVMKILLIWATCRWLCVLVPWVGVKLLWYRMSGIVWL